MLKQCPHIVIYLLVFYCILVLDLTLKLNSLTEVCCLFFHHAPSLNVHYEWFNRKHLKMSLQIDLFREITLPGRK